MIFWKIAFKNKYGWLNHLIKQSYSMTKKKRSLLDFFLTFSHKDREILYFSWSLYGDLSKTWSQ
jgi:hypothetical protein